MHCCCLRCVHLTTTALLRQSAMTTPQKQLPHAFRLNQVLRNVFVEFVCFHLAMWHGCFHRVPVSFFNLGFAMFVMLRVFADLVSSQVIIRMVGVGFFKFQSFDEVVSRGSVARLERRRGLLSARVRLSAAKVAASRERISICASFSRAIPNSHFLAFFTVFCDAFFEVMVVFVAFDFLFGGASSSG
ncbi:hypothetical protein KCU87_g356, partial [Aureobasidium melanogenum]